MPDQCATCGAGDALLFRCEYCDRQFCADHVFPSHACEHFARDAGPSATETGTGSEGSTEEGVGFEWGAGAPGTERTTTAADEDDDSADSPTAEPADAFAGSGFRPVGAGGTTAATADPSPTPRDTRGDGTPAIRPAPAEPAGTAAPAVERVVEPRPVGGAATPAVRNATPDPRCPPAGEWAVRPATGRVPERRGAPEPEPLLADADTGAGAGARADGAGTATAAGAAGDTEPTEELPIRPMDLARSPGTAERSEPRTLGDWLRQQTYVSLTVKTGAIAAVINAALYLGMLLATSGLLQRFAL